MSEAQEPEVVLKLNEPPRWQELYDLVAEACERPEFPKVQEEFRQAFTPEQARRLLCEHSRVLDALQEAILFMKDAKRVSIKSRGMQLEAEFFGGE